MIKHLLVLNPGSSSLKFSVFSIENKQPKSLVMSGMVSVSGNKSVLLYQTKGKKQQINYAVGNNLKAWWQYIHDILKDLPIEYVGIRIVHGGEKYQDTTKIDKQFLSSVIIENKTLPLSFIELKCVITDHTLEVNTNMIYI
jgi:acetate kinase